MGTWLKRAASAADAQEVAQVLEQVKHRAKGAATISILSPDGQDPDWRVVIDAPTVPDQALIRACMELLG